MTQHETYMQRCLDLAAKGLGQVAPNPMVGSVIVYQDPVSGQDRIIGEGYHRIYGQAHAEVNAIQAVKDPALLRDSTLYVNLEPCNHQGKTPPCTRLILDQSIPRVVIGCRDPNPATSGAGIKALEENGVEVISGVLGQQSKELNRRFFVYHEQHRPYLMLKWAQTLDGYIDVIRETNNPQQPTWITGKDARQWVHKWRSEEPAILVGRRTAEQDDPALTVRDWQGDNPLRCVIDPELKLASTLKLFDGTAETLVFTRKKVRDRSNLKYITIREEQEMLAGIFQDLYKREILSLIVEGGRTLHQSLIDTGLWDEARVFTGAIHFGKGIPAPRLNVIPLQSTRIGKDRLDVYRNRSEQ